MRVGFLGGTFDPIHNAHLIIAEEARARLHLDVVLFAPAGRPPHKLGRDLTDDEQRVTMVNLAIATNPGFRLSRLDLDRVGPHYSADAVELLHRHLPDSEIHFIMGADSLAEITTWHEPARLIAQARLAVTGRPDYPVSVQELERMLPGLSERIDWVNAPLLEISSTDIKRRVRQGLPIRYQLPDAVEQYIREQGLYRQV